MFRSVKQIVAVVVLAGGSTSQLFAWGGGDYKIGIEAGYYIVRANSLDVSLGSEPGHSIYSPSGYAQTGPIAEYSITPTHIYLRVLGRKPRQAFEGDDFEEVDASKEFFFIFDKQHKHLDGPLTRNEFLENAIVVNQKPTSWIAPKDPRQSISTNLGYYLFWGTVTLGVFLSMAWIVWCKRKCRPVQK